MSDGGLPAVVVGSGGRLIFTGCRHRRVHRSSRNGSNGHSFRTRLGVYRFPAQKLDRADEARVVDYAAHISARNVCEILGSFVRDQAEIEEFGESGESGESDEIWSWPPPESSSILRTRARSRLQDAVVIVCSTINNIGTCGLIS